MSEIQVMDDIEEIETFAMCNADDMDPVPQNELSVRVTDVPTNDKDIVRFIQHKRMLSIANDVFVDKDFAMLMQNVASTSVAMLRIEADNNKGEGDRALAAAIAAGNFGRFDGNPFEKATQGAVIDVKAINLGVHDIDEMELSQVNETIEYEIVMQPDK